MKIELTKSEAADLKDILESEYRVVKHIDSDYVANLASMLEKLNVKLQYTRNR